MDYFFSAQGRIGRRTYFFRRLGIFLGYFAACLATVAVLNFSGYVLEGQDSSILALVLVIPFAIADVLQSIKRCHDLNLSGWYVLLTGVPLLGLIPAFKLLFAAGTPGANRFGADPHRFPSLTGLAASD